MEKTYRKVKVAAELYTHDQCFWLTHDYPLSRDLHYSWRADGQHLFLGVDPLHHTYSKEQDQYFYNALVNVIVPVGEYALVIFDERDQKEILVWGGEYVQPAFDKDDVDWMEESSVDELEEAFPLWELL